MAGKNIDETTRAIQKFFPEYHAGHAEKEREPGFDKGPEYLHKPDDILPYLQTLFFEERVISVQIDDITRIYSTILWDNLPELIEEERDGETVLVAPEYEAGSYLKSFSHINILPLEPVAGNILVRGSSRIVLFFYAGTTSVEIGVTFSQVATVRDQQVLQCTFPGVARIIRNNRAYRAKTVKDQDVFVRVRTNDETGKPEEFLLFDLSTHGLAFGSAEPLEGFEIDMGLKLVIDCRGPEPIELAASIRNFNKVRTKQGNMHLCGVLFDLENRVIASRVERKYAALQRAFIRSLNEETDGMDVDLRVL